jgi:hypothetical protein
VRLTWSSCKESPRIGKRSFSSWVGSFLDDVVLSSLGFVVLVLVMVLLSLFDVNEFSSLLVADGTDERKEEEDDDEEVEEVAEKDVE